MTGAALLKALQGLERSLLANNIVHVRNSTKSSTTMPPSWLFDAVESNEQENRATTSSNTVTSPNTASPISPISPSQSQSAREPQTQARRRSSNRDPEVRAGSSNPPANRPERRSTSGASVGAGTRERAIENPFSSPSRHASNNTNTAGSTTNQTRAYPSLSEFDPYSTLEGDTKYDERRSTSGTTNSSQQEDMERRRAEQLREDNALMEALISSSNGSSSRSPMNPSREEPWRRRGILIGGGSSSSGAGGYGDTQGAPMDWRDDGGRSSSDNRNRLGYLLQRQNDRRAPLEQERENQYTDFLEQLVGAMSLGASGSGPGYPNMNTFMDDRYRAPPPFSFGNTRPNDDLTSPFQSSQASSAPPPLAVLACEVCGTPTFQLCSGCQILGYCNREHQEKVCGISQLTTSY